MAIDFSNYINTYKGSSVLQQQFPNMNDYLALFGYNQGTTPSSATTSTTTTTPTTTSGIPNIINQNINQFQQGGGGWTQEVLMLLEKQLDMMKKLKEH